MSNKIHQTNLKKKAMYITSFRIPSIDTHIVMIDGVPYPATLADQIQGYTVTQDQDKNYWLDKNGTTQAPTPTVLMSYFTSGSDILKNVESVSFRPNERPR